MWHMDHKVVGHVDLRPEEIGLVAIGVDLVRVRADLVDIHIELAAEVDLVPVVITQVVPQSCKKGNTTEVTTNQSFRYRF